MQKGQISLDLTLAILVAIVVVVALSVTVNQVQENQQETVLINSLKKEAFDTATLILQAQILEDTNFRIEKKIDWTYYKNKKSPPVISIDTNKITIKESLSGKDLTAEEYFYKNPNTIIEYTNDTLVIRNA